MRISNMTRSDTDWSSEGKRGVRNLLPEDLAWILYVIVLLLCGIVAVAGLAVAVIALLQML